MKKIYLGIFVLVPLLLVLFLPGCGNSFEAITILSDYDNENLAPLIRDFEKKYNTSVSLHYYGPVELMIELNEHSGRFDAVWAADSLWISLSGGGERLQHLSPITVSPVVFGVRKGLAEELGFTAYGMRMRGTQTEKIISAVRSNELSFLMASPVQSTSGALAYLGFLEALLGDSGPLTAEDLNSGNLDSRIRALFSGIRRSSGDSLWLKELFTVSAFEGMVNYEFLILEANRELASRGREPLHIIYPPESIGSADSPLGFIEGGSRKKKQTFLKLQEYLLSPEVQEKMTLLGRRTRDGSISETAAGTIFPPELGAKAFGADTGRPAPEIAAEALNRYQTVLKKPSLTLFCLDYSKSMQGGGIAEMKKAMSTIQTGENDITLVMPFSSAVLDVRSVKGNDPEKLKDLLDTVSEYPAGGGTDIYTPVITALNIISEYENLGSYLPAIILMTDGKSNEGRTFTDLQRAWKTYGVDVPVFSIQYGDAEQKQLEQISRLTRGRVFDGRNNLVRAFRKAVGYN